MGIRKVKAKQWFWFWWDIVWKHLIAPLRDPTSILSLMVTFICVILLINNGKLDVALNSVTEGMTSLKAFGYAYVLYALWGISKASFEVREKIKEVGEWYGDRFVYNTPKHMATFHVTANRLHQCFYIKFVGAEPNSIVKTKIEIDNKRTKAIMGPCHMHNSVTENMLEMIIDNPNNNPTHDPLIDKNRMAKLHVCIKPQTDPTTITVYMQSWEVQCPQVSTHP